MGSHGLQPAEQRVMDLWDAGLTVRDISRQTGLAYRWVRNVVWLYDDRDDPAERIAAKVGSDRLAAAIIALQQRGGR